MRKATLEEWKIIQEQPVRPHLTHSLYESDCSGFAFYFSQIEEWSVMKFCAKLQIYQYRLSPKKIYDSGEVWFLFNETEYIYDWTLDKLVCFRQLINSGNNNYSFPFIIINLSDLMYTAIDDNSLKSLTKNSSDSVIGIKMVANNSEKEIFVTFRFDDIIWRPLNSLTKTPCRSWFNLF